MVLGQFSVGKHPYRIHGPVKKAEGQVETVSQQLAMSLHKLTVNPSEVTDKIFPDDRKDFKSSS